MSDDLEEEVARAIGTALGEYRENEGWRLGEGSQIIGHMLARAAIACMQRWCPIETAPKDGTIIDLLFKGNTRSPTRFTDCKWSDGEWWSVEVDEPMVCISHGELQPTHWMPRPDPPK
jgi:hypothetical protein